MLVNLEGWIDRREGLERLGDFSLNSEQRRTMFRQEEKTKLYLLNVIKGLAGDETGMSRKEERRKLLMTGLAQAPPREGKAWDGGES